MAQGSIKKVIIGEGDKRRTVYRARIDAGVDKTGKRKQQMTTHATKKAAQEWVTMQLRALATGTYVDPSTLTFGAYLAAWLDGPARRLHPNTVRTYASLINSRIEPALGGVLLQDLRFSRLEAFMHDQAATAKPATRQTMLAVLRGSLRDAQRENLVASNPALLLDSPTVTHGEIRAWDQGQARAFVAAARNEPEYPLHLLLLATGLRIGEAMALKWADVDLDGGTVRVLRTLTRNREGDLVMGDRPKSPSGRREVPLDPGVATVLREHRLRQLQYRMAHADVWDDADLVFPNAVGGISPTETIRDRFRAMCTRAGVPYVGLHGLRRTAATVLLANGESLKATADLLGHSGMDVTFQRYVKATDRQRRETGAALARAVLGS